MIGNCNSFCLYCILYMYYRYDVNILDGEYVIGLIDAFEDESFIFGGG